MEHEIIAGKIALFFDQPGKYPQKRLEGEESDRYMTYEIPDSVMTGKMSEFVDKYLSRRKHHFIAPQGEEYSRPEKTGEIRTFHPRTLENMR